MGMMNEPRRAFLRTLMMTPIVPAMALAARRGAAESDDASGTPRKAVLVSMLPDELSYVDRFRLAREVGFAGVEVHTVSDTREAEDIARAAEETGLEIHSVMNSGHWEFPLSSPDADAVSKSVGIVETSIRNAALWKAEVVLLVPAVVNEEVSYRQAWERSQRVIRERILPMAERHQVVIAVEEVWNKFLLSPLEFARYVDELDSPWIRAYFDVGNIVFYGYPQDWIRTLGKRIVRLHLKDFKLDRKNGRFEWVNLGDGDIDWVAVRKALTEIGYGGYMTTEIEGGDEAYLEDVVARIDRFLAGKPPVG
ncbi:MAG: TIM barrel protein [Luteitalea sp.]|nr:TIM barrel protein [Luteitalea sp.]